jgi:uncharacterized protein YukE
VDYVRVDVDRLEDYATALDRGADEAQAALRSVARRRLEPEAFGEIGRALGTPQAYQRAADRLEDQLDQAQRVLVAAATALREAADHYRGEDTDAARTLEQRGAAD